MKVKAVVSFSGIITMAAGEERELEKGPVLSDLLSCGYVEELEEKATKKKGVKKDEG